MEPRMTAPTSAVFRKLNPIKSSRLLQALVRGL